jgi:hypothetical protein
MLEARFEVAERQLELQREPAASAVVRSTSSSGRLGSALSGRRMIRTSACGSGLWSSEATQTPRTSTFIARGEAPSPTAGSERENVQRTATRSNESGCMSSFQERATSGGTCARSERSRVSISSPVLASSASRGAAARARRTDARPFGAPLAPLRSRQTPAPERFPMEMPGPGSVHRRLQEFVGTWIGKETMHPSPWSPVPVTAEGRVVASLQLGGFFLVSRYEQRVGGQKTFEGQGIYGWDARRERYTMHWFDTMGNDPGAPALGTWEGQLLVFENETPMGKGRYRYEFLGAGRYRFEMAMSADGKTWAPILDGLYERQG